MSGDETPFRELSQLQSFFFDKSDETTTSSSTSVGQCLFPDLDVSQIPPASPHVLVLGTGNRTVSRLQLDSTHNFTTLPTICDCGLSADVTEDTLSVTACVMMYATCKHILL